MAASVTTVKPGPQHVGHWEFACATETCGSWELTQPGLYPEGWAFMADGSCYCPICAVELGLVDEDDEP